ncbi:guanine nucleotide-binding -like 1 [Labeo rohita]|uniref:Guanine nucleotide-binding-like 1 n=1 Tax=Labeo rohita TaxID=84645 RepID=A0A498LBW2_LABRO|nr:guanine nucleotide-binding -like 1 [Labeo rohita]
MPRRKPFSNKQKKKQLQTKREKKRGGFRLHFEKESKEEVEKRKKIAREKILKPVAEKEMEIDMNQIYPEDKGLDFPRRPSWHYNMRREELLRKEEKSFLEYLEALHSKNPPGTLSHFEHNLETWRQLWRVMEMSDVILLIVDIRHPVLQFPPALYHYITSELKKYIILVLNKVDLCPPPLVLAWKHYLTKQFPHLHCICFTSQPGQPYSTLLQKKRMRKKVGWNQAGGPIHIMRACQEITAGRVDLSSWEKKIQRDAVAVGTEGDQADDGSESVLMEHHSDVAMEMNSPTQELYKDGVLTLGCIAWAERRGYKTAKAARNDVYRAANSLLRLAIDGRLCLCLRPPGYTQSKDEWESHPGLAEIIAIQGRKEEEEECGDREDDEGESSSELEEENDRDADDDEDADGDDEDDTVKADTVKAVRKGLTLNMFSVLGENECE